MESERAMLMRLLERNLRREGAASGGGDGHIADDEYESGIQPSQPRPRPRRQTKRMRGPFYHPGRISKSELLNRQKVRNYNENSYRGMSHERSLGSHSCALPKIDENKGRSTAT